MREIQLTQGKITLVDDEDFEFLSQWKWQFHIGHSRHTGYARRSEYPLGRYGKQKLIWLHHIVMNVLTGFNVDHINGNGLDNQKVNLRICDNSQNQHNARLRKDNKSGYKGVSFYKTRQIWQVQITIKTKKIHVVYFENKETAALAYNAAAREYFGEFARLNLIVIDKERGKVCQPRSGFSS